MRVVLTFAVLAIITAVARAEDWPGWRGPTGMGQSAEKDLPVTWGGKDGMNILWKAPLYAGTDKVRYDQNQSSPVVMGDRVFVTLSYWPPGVAVEKAAPEHHVVCFRKGDGHRLWDRAIPPGPWRLTDLRGGYTAPTPAADAETVYVLFGSSVVAALDREGKVVWRKEITPFAFDVAMGVSPVLYRDSVLVAWDQTDKTSRLIALDRKSGDVKWVKKRPTADWAHSTPVLAEVKGKTQLLVASATALEGLDPATGETIWSCASGDAKPDRIGDTVSPVLAGGLVYADSGRGGPGIAVDPAGTGDVTKTHLKWKIPKVPDGSIGSPVAVGEYLYRLQSPDLLHCWRLADGKLVFAERLPGSSAVPSP
ncbi:MAG TPA: PQQ-binding-like beta-propeller repeat protein, partial [Gemmataceae bacterium]|nr:PQQ-binding-like beta-propeller repeat protein [Gemmataceae bacterium]